MVGLLRLRACSRSQRPLARSVPYSVVAATDRVVVSPASRLQSALAVPIVSEGETAGVLTFYARSANAFSETHRQMASGAAYVVARGSIGMLRQSAAPLVV